MTIDKDERAFVKNGSIFDIDSTIQTAEGNHIGISFIDTEANGDFAGERWYVYSPDVKI